MASPLSWLTQTRRLDLIYVVPGETEAQSFPDLRLSNLGIRQLTASAAKIRRSGVKPEAVLLVRGAVWQAFQDMTHLLSEELGHTPIRIDTNNNGNGATEANLSQYLQFPVSRLVVPITGTGMHQLLRQLDPAQIVPTWTAAPEASAWHVRVTCSLNSPPLVRSITLVARLA